MIGKRIAMALALVAVALAGGWSQAADTAIRSVAAVLETQDLGQVVVGARIEYESPVKAKDVNYLKTFIAEGYPIIGTYVNDDGEWENAKQAGKYVFLKFAVNPVPGRDEGKTTVHDGRRMQRKPVHVGMRQLQPLTMANGTVAPMTSMTTDSEINLLVDDYIPVTFTDSAGTSINYRLFVPKGYEAKGEGKEKLPLVVFLHGAGQNGDNNITQLLASPSALDFSKPEAQAKHPCFVMAPQAPGPLPSGGMWADYEDKERTSALMSPALKAVVEAIHALTDEYNIDNKRIYGTGLSAGSRGTFIAAINNPDLYAALLLLASIDVYTDEQVKPFLNKPIWMILSADEAEERLTKTSALMDQFERLGVKINRRVGDQAMNGYLRGTKAREQAEDQLREAQANGQNILFTHLMEGTVLHNPHWSWVWAYNNEAVRDWLFSHSKH